MPVASRHSCKCITLLQLSQSPDRRAARRDRGAQDRLDEALPLLGAQMAWAVGGLALAAAIWRAGLRRHAVVGG